MKNRKIGHFLNKYGRIFGVFAIILGIIGVGIGAFRVVFGASAVAGETVIVTYNESTEKYGDYAVADRLSTRMYRVTSSAGTFNALCASPSKAAPDNGATGVAQLVTDDSIKRLFLASVAGPMYNAAYWANSYVDNNNYASDLAKAHSIIGGLYENGGVVAGVSWTQAGANEMYSIRNNVLSAMSGVDISGYNVYVVRQPGGDSNVQDIMWAEPIYVPTPPEEPEEPETHVLYIFKRSSVDNSLLDGAVFDIYNNANCTGTPATGTTGAMGHEGQIWAGNVQDGMTYCVIERTAPDGYTKDSTPKIFTGNGVDVTLTFYNTPITPEPEPEPARGGVKVQVCDKDTNKITPQGDAKFAGTVFGIYNEGDELVTTITANENGMASTGNNELTEGEYYVSMLSAGTGYRKSEAIKTFTVDKAHDGQIIEAGNICSEIKRGNLIINKKDAESEDGSALLGATLAGAKFSVVNRSDSVVVVNGREIPILGKITEVTVGEDLKATVEDLPYGEYIISELAVGKNYAAPDHTSVVGLHNFGNYDEVSFTMDFENKIIRGDIAFIKVDQDGKPMAGVKFRLTRLDDEGVKNVVEITTGSNGRFTTYGGNVWVHKTDKTADNRGRLPFGRYRLEEISTEANEGYKMIEPLTFEIKEEGVTVNLGTFKNEKIVPPEEPEEPTEPEKPSEPEPTKPGVVPDTGRFMMEIGGARVNSWYLMVFGGVMVVLGVWMLKKSMRKSKIRRF